MNVKKNFENKVRLFINFYGNDFTYNGLPFHDKCILKALWFQMTELDMSVECESEQFKETVISLLIRQSYDYCEVRELLIDPILTVFSRSNKHLEKYIQQIQEEYSLENGDDHE